MTRMWFVHECVGHTGAIQTVCMVYVLVLFVWRGAYGHTACTYVYMGCMWECVVCVQCACMEKVCV